MLQGPRPWPWVGSYMLIKMYEPSERKHTSTRVWMLKQWSTLNEGWHLFLLCALLSGVCNKNKWFPDAGQLLFKRIRTQNNSSRWYFVSLNWMLSCHSRTHPNSTQVQKAMKLVCLHTHTETFRPLYISSWFSACILTSTPLEEWPNPRWSNPRRPQQKWPEPKWPKPRNSTKQLNQFNLVC